MNKSIKKGSDQILIRAFVDLCCGDRLGKAYAEQAQYEVGGLVE